MTAVPRHLPSDRGRRPEVPSRRSRRFAVTAVVAVASIVLAACGGATSGPGATSRSRATTGPGAAKRTTVYRWGVVGNRGAIAQLQLDTPTAVAGITGRVVQIATSNSDGYALTSTGAVYAWGVNSYGELGDGRLTPYVTTAVEVAFPSGVTIRSLANPMPFDAGLAVDSTGHVWGWGLDAVHDLCLPGLVVARPRRLPLVGVTLATGARTHSLFDERGTIVACGSGDAGELGNGSTASVGTPTPVVGLPAGVGVTALVSSWEGSGALLAGGAYYDWGYGAAGQLGDGATADSAVPVEVHLPGPVTQVFEGGSGPTNGQTVAVVRGHGVWAWGSNGRGQLGVGTRTSSAVPVPVHVPAGATFNRVASGGSASYALDSSGRLWAWGDNRHGQLGTGSRPRLAALPVDVGRRFTQVTSTAQNVAGLSATP